MTSDQKLSSRTMAAVLQVPSTDWLKVYGLSCQGLTLDQLLPTLGFQQKQGHVNGQRVTSQYGDGLFMQHPDSSGKVYNLCQLDKLEPIKNKLQDAVDQLKARHKWLTSGSRLPFGVVYGRRVVMVMDSCANEHAQLKPYLSIAADVIADQFRHVDKFNLIRCSNGGIETWRADLVNSEDKSIADALEWVEKTTPQTPPTTQDNVVEAITRAQSYSEVDGVYLFSHGKASLRAFDLLLEKISAAPSTPVHVVVYDCSSLQAMEQYKQMAQASGAKCHIYNPPPVKGNPLHSSSLSSVGSKSSPLSAHSSRTGSGHGSTLTPRLQVNEDVDLIWAELDQARDTLAQVQALQLEATIDTADSSCCRGNSEEYMTSEQWLQTHGLKHNKLMFEDFVSSLAFLHCNGTVKMLQPTRRKQTGNIEMVPQSKMVHAQYCKEFVHMRLPKEGVVHIQLSDHTHSLYCEQVRGVAGACQSRLDWLKQGSREMFGTVLENKVAMVIDTSSSMGERLELVKEKMQQLIQEQLCEKEEFTLLHFSSSVGLWSEQLVPTSEENLQAASQWVEELRAGGSSNTMYALIKALSLPGVEAVYLLTDGRPDQEADEVMKEVEQLPKLPVHTISFNCADSAANHFLAELSTKTGGRYHYLSEDVSDPEGPKTYQGEDIEALENEMKLAMEQIAKADELLAECQAARKKKQTGRKKGSAKKTVVSRSTKKPEGNGSTHDLRSTSKPKKAKVLMSSKRWLEKNSLSALHLTLMDALGPSSIPHSAKHVPLLDKHVTSKVFDSLFPLAHVTKGHKVKLINPTGANLPDYEQKLDKQVGIYWNRLTRLAWSALPPDKRDAVCTRCGISDSSELLYQQHRDILREVLEESGWPRPKKDFDLLEAEIQQAKEYKEYSVSLREEAGRTERDDRLRLPSGTSIRSIGDETSLGLFSTTSDESLVELMDQLQLHTVTPSPPPRGTATKGKNVNSKLASLKGQKVIARSKDNGFYYPGVVTGHTDSRHAVVQLADGLMVPTLVKHVLPVGGAGPCPVLQVGDYVLVRVRTHNGPHPAFNGTCDYYIPGIVQVLPADSRKSHALHSVLVFNGRIVTCTRRGMVKIAATTYTAACKFIRARMQGTGMKSKAESHSNSGSENGSSRSHSRTSIHIPSVTSQYNSGEEEGESETHSQLTSRGTTPSEQSPEHRPNSSPYSEGGPLLGTELQSVVEQQRSYGELLDQYRRDMDTLTHKQLELEEKFSRQGNYSFDPQSDTAASDPLPEGGAISPRFCDQGVNTGPWMEDKGVVTDPQLESRGVGTELLLSDMETADIEEELEEDLDLPDGHESSPSGAHLSNVTSPANSPIHPLPSPSLPQADSSASSPAHTDSPLHENMETPQPTPVHEQVQHTPHSTPSNSKEHTPQTTPTKSKDHTPQVTPTHLTTSDLSLSNHQPKLADVSYFEEEDDPIVDQEVLARWPDDGWYYRGVVVRPAGQFHYQVEDAIHDVETIHMADIITDQQDAQKPLQLGDTVAALHPDYPFSYAPGKIVGVSGRGLHFTVELYDGTQSLLPRQEIYHLARGKHHSDVEYIERKEKAWIGQAVIARNNTDGLYYPGKVLKQVERARRWYVIKWASEATQEQEAIHMYGKLTKQRPLRIGDKVLALAQSNRGVFMPGEIQGVQIGKLDIEFCDGKHELVEPTHCFWVSGDYYQSAVEYICSTVQLTPTPSLSTLSETSEVQSEYSASYLH